MQYYAIYNFIIYSICLVNYQEFSQILRNLERFNSINPDNAKEIEIFYDSHKGFFFYYVFLFSFVFTNMIFYLIGLFMSEQYYYFVFMLFANFLYSYLANHKIISRYDDNTVLSYLTFHLFIMTLLLNSYFYNLDIVKILVNKGIDLIIWN
jgi:hypothetical protein